MDPFVIPYIMLEDAKKASEFYISALGGEVRYTMLGKDTPNCPEDQKEAVMHLEYVVNGSVIYMSDFPQGDIKSIDLHLNYKDKEDMKLAFEKMRKNAKEVQELKEEFWGAIFGRIVDQFGVTWQFHVRA